MVVVKIGEREIYLDGYLKTNLDIHKDDVLYRDSDCIILVDGCLTGNSVISFKNKGFNQKKTLLELFLQKRKYLSSKTFFVKSFNGKKIVKQKVKDIVFSGRKKVYKLTLENGMSVECTKNHKFLKMGGFFINQWIEFKDLQIGDLIKLGDNASYSRIKTRELIGMKDTYDIKCRDPNHNFIANGILVHNSEGAGKSVLGQQVALYLDPTFNINDICFDGEDFKKKIISAKKFKCIVFDESLSALNKMKSIDSLTVSVVDLLAEIRQKNLFIIIILPSMFDLAKPIACWRTKFLLHVYKHGDDMQRGFYSAFSYDKKMLLYTIGRKYYNYGAIVPNFRAKFVDGYTVNSEDYRQLKLDNLRAYSDKKKTKETREEKKDRFRLYQLMSYLVETAKMNEADIGYVFGLSETTVKMMLSDGREDFDGVDDDEEVIENIKMEQKMKREKFLSGLNKV